MSENYWSVTVSLNGEPVVTIEPNMLSGKDIGDPEIAAIRESALSLLAFAGIDVVESDWPAADLSWLPPDIGTQTDNSGTETDLSANAQDEVAHRPE